MHLVVVVRRQVADGQDVMDEHEDGQGEEGGEDGDDHEIEAATRALGSLVGDAVPGEGGLGRLGHLTVTEIGQD